MKSFGINTGTRTLFGALLAASLSISGCGGGNGSGVGPSSGGNIGSPRQPLNMFLLGNNGDIYTSKDDGSGLKNITNTPGKIESPIELSPDGKHISYTILHESPPQVWICDIDGKNPHPLKKDRTLNNISFVSQARWSPDGSLIAFRGADGQSQMVQIYVCKSDGTEPRLVTEYEGQDKMVWHPNGKSLAFSEIPRGAPFQITSVDLDGSNRRVLVSNASNGFYSPDGAKMLYQEETQYPNWFIKDLDGNGSPMRVSGPDIYYALWNHDGSEILTREESGALPHRHHIRRSDGSGTPRLLPFSEPYIRVIDWK